MKMSRSQLKSLIKECIVEILNEGLGGAVSSEEPRTFQSKQTMADSRSRQSPIPERRQPMRSQTNEMVKMAAAGNPMLESILADTAATTYQDQEAADRPGFIPKVGVEAYVDRSSPEQLFGEETAANWMAILDRTRT
jgi:hypothetical protein